MPMTMLFCEGNTEYYYKVWNIGHGFECQPWELVSPALQHSYLVLAQQNKWSVPEEVWMKYYQISIAKFNEKHAPKPITQNPKFKCINKVVI